MQRMSDAGLAFLVAHEGVVPGPYRDSVGVWTFGVGHTAAAGSPDPAKMPRGMPSSLDAGLAEAFRVLRQDLPRYEAAVRNALGREVPQHEFDAAVSFHYNTGAIARATWVKTWKAGDRATAARQMMDWRKPAEIIPRREAERDLFLHGTYGSKTAAVWPVDATGRITWRPVRTLTQAQIVAMARPTKPPSRPSMPPRAEPRADPVAASAPIAIVILVALVAAYFILGA